MTRKEELQRKAALCHKASLKVRGFMRTVWQQKRNELLIMADEVGEGDAGESKNQPDL